MQFPLSPSEAAEQSTGARFALLGVQHDERLEVSHIHGLRQAIGELDLTEEAIVQIQLSYNCPEGKEFQVTVNLTHDDALPDFRFSQLADDGHPLTIFMLGVTGNTAARVREIICSCPVIRDPNANGSV